MPSEESSNKIRTKIGLITDSTFNHISHVAFFTIFYHISHAIFITELYHISHVAFFTIFYHISHTIFITELYHVLNVAFFTIFYHISHTIFITELYHISHVAFFTIFYHISHAIFFTELYHVLNVLFFEGKHRQIKSKRSWSSGWIFQITEITWFPMWVSQNSRGKRMTREQWRASISTNQPNKSIALQTWKQQRRLTKKLPCVHENLTALSESAMKNSPK